MNRNVVPDPAIGVGVAPLLSAIPVVDTSEFVFLPIEATDVSEPKPMVEAAEVIP
jgi:hypothetical protein